VFLRALPQAGAAVSLPRAQPGPLADTLRRAPVPVRHIVVAVPLGATRLDAEGLARRLGPHFVVRRFRAWLLVEGEGPYASRAAAHAALQRIVAATQPALRGDVPPQVEGWLALERRVLEDT
jgi:hypothetical protein